MSALTSALWGEMLKARRSKVPWLSAAGFTIGPLAGGFFMIVMKDPALARRLGMISAKAQIVAGASDWPTMWSLLAQVAAMGGLMLFSLITSWVFGREYSDHTLKDLAALPTPRAAIVGAKFAVVAVWCAVLTVWVTGVGLGIGAWVGLPSAPIAVFWQGIGTVAVTAGLTLLLMPFIAWAASAGRGYLPPMGAALLSMVLAQVVAAAGWGEYFPWSVPALRTGMAGPDYAHLGAISYIIVLLTGLIGALATVGWWAWADQT